MTPLWALATWWFLRSYETRKPLHAVLAGLAAAAAMLGKYWAIFLLLGLGLAALIDPRRRAYFASPAPWLTIAAGAVGIAPHLAWLYANDFKPFGYAMESHAADLWDALMSGVDYVTGAAAYLAIPTVVALVAARPSLGAVLDTIRPREPARRLALNAFVLPLLLPIAGALLAHEEVVSLWTIGSMTLFPIVLLSSPQLTIGRLAARRILRLAIAVPVVIAALSPVIAIVIHRQGVPNYASQYRLVAQAVDGVWRQTTDRPLRLFGSYNNLLYGALFYFPERPSTLDVADPAVTPWTDAARIAREGIAMVCPVEEPGCVKAMDDLAARGPAGKRAEVELSRSYLGVADKPARYVIVTIPPAS
jgi:hypothetical protein